MSYRAVLGSPALVHGVLAPCGGDAQEFCVAPVGLAPDRGVNDNVRVVLTRYEIAAT